MSENAADMLERLGTDAVLWAKEFRKTAIRLGYSDMDEGWLIGWFANAIERCDVVRCNPLRAELAEAKIEIERQRARVIKWVNAAMRNEEYDDDGR
jgi:hypothetical protein